MSGVSSRAFRPRRLALVIGVVVSVTAIAIALVRLPLGPERRLDSKIRWAEQLSEADKQAAARELGLSVVRVRDDGVWVVQPADASPQAVRRLVTDPRVADTDEIDRQRYALRSVQQTIPEWALRRYAPVVRWFQALELPSL